MTHQPPSDFDVDLSRFVAPSQTPRGLRRLLKVWAEPGLTFAWLMRLQIRLESRGATGRARLVHLVNLRMTGGEMGHGCSIGAGFVAKHPLGVVIGGGTVLGTNCTVLHNVTFGEIRPGTAGAEHSYPIVGNDVVVGNGAAVLGPISIGDGATIGAGAVVLRSVPAGAIAVGVPASIRPAQSAPRN